MLSEIVERSLHFEYHDGALPDDAPAGTSTGWRVLPFLMFCSTRGEFILHLKDSPAAVIGTGEGLLIPAGLAHKLDIGKGRAWAMWCHVNYTTLGTVDVVPHLHLPNVIRSGQTKPLANICRKLVTMHAESPRSPLWAAARVKVLGFRFLAHLIEIAKPQQEHTDFFLRSRSLEPVLRHIQHHLADSLNIDELARIACRSRSGFHQYFRDLMGKPPMEFVRALRIRSAQMLLTGSDLQVAEIARRVGYPNQFQFSRIFKASCGMSPTVFRAEQREGLWSKRSSPTSTADNSRR